MFPKFALKIKEYTDKFPFSYISRLQHLQKKFTVLKFKFDPVFKDIEKNNT